MIKWDQKYKFQNANLSRANRVTADHALVRVVFELTRQAIWNGKDKDYRNSDTKLLSLYQIVYHSIIPVSIIHEKHHPYSPSVSSSKKSRKVEKIGKVIV